MDILKVDVPDTTMRLISQPGRSYLVLESGNPLRTLNTAPWGGGFGNHRSILNRQVDKSYDCSDPVAEMAQFLREEGREPDETAGLLTAARVRDYGFCAMDNAEQAGFAPDEALSVQSWVTAGLGNTARAGASLKPDELFPGTINMIVLIDGALSDHAMANCVITATEAKVAALQELGVRVRGNATLSATGTTTDAMVIAATGRGRQRDYAGTATWLGYLIGRTVYEAMLESGRKYVDPTVK